MIKKGLGKGLGALIESETTENDNNGVRELKIIEIEPNLNQPRKKFDDEKLLQLAESIKQHGVVQPIIVKKEDGGYRIVTGERRWRAARLAGLPTIPVVVRDLSNKQVMEIALIENLQREDLNPIEEAEAYERLINEYKMTQEEVSKAIGKSRPAIANAIRLLGLSKKIKEHIINGDVSTGHARTLLAMEKQEDADKVVEDIIKRKLNVRETESLVKRLNSKKTGTAKKIINENMIAIEEKLRGIFGTKVRLLSSKRKGKILIEYYSNDELERILEMVESIGISK